MTATVVAKIGPVKAKFSGKVRFENVDPPNGYSIVGEGTGGVAGFAKGGADVKLTDDGAGTLLAYTAKAQVGGKLAQLGSRLIDGTAKMMADQFFSAFSEKVGGAALAEGVDATPVTADGGEVAVKEDAIERVVHAAEAVERQVEERVETAAIKSGPSGPMLWGLIALAAVVVVLLIAAL